MPGKLTLKLDTQTGSTNPALKTRVLSGQFLICKALPTTNLQRLLGPHRPVCAGRPYSVVRVQMLYLRMV